MKEIIKLIRHTAVLKDFYIKLAIINLLVASLNLVYPFTIRSIVNQLVEVVGNPDRHDFIFLAMLVAIIFTADLFQTFLQFVGGRLGDRLAVRLDTILTSRYLDRLLYLPQRFFDDQESGQLISYLHRGMSSVTSFFQNMANNLISTILTTIFVIIATSYYLGPVGIILVLLFPIYIYLTRQSSKRWMKFQKQINQLQDTAFGRLGQVASQMRLVKSYTSEVFEKQIFDQNRKDVESIHLKQSNSWHQYDFYRKFILNILLGLVNLYVVWMAYKGKINIGEFALIIQLIAQAKFPLFAISFIVDSVQRARTGTNEYFDLIDQEIETLATKDTKPSTHKPKSIDKMKQARVSFEHISFYYKQGNQVLSDINLAVEPGQKVALVGRSGEGKTTITNLLLGLYSDYQGEIKINGQDIREYDLQYLRSQIAIVFQDPWMFSTSIYQNISYGTKASLKQVKRAAKLANADQFIEKLSDGYDTQVGERGVKLSGGQKQRIAIARAILKDAPILILDEATSSLDSIAEGEVQTALNNLMKNRTTVIIAHRLSTIARVDKIYGIEQGRVVESGSPQQLAKHPDGIYARLLKLQSDSSYQAHQQLEEFGIG
ncbi:ABC transporter ATP-binding protein [Candidatus Saccharibacteria bacterium]|nr:ABC transporter ATP-binding protein [Candidatus Saccharibacteria bacterium]